MRIIPLITATLFAALTLSPHGLGQEIRALNLGGDFYSIDPKTRQETLIGSLGYHGYPWVGYAQDQNGVQYGVTGDWVVGHNFYEIDPIQGTRTFLAHTDFYGIRQIAFDDSNRLLVIDDPKGPSYGGIHDLYSFDVSTNTKTLIGSTGMMSIFSIAFFDGTLYGLDRDHGLVTIDIHTGLATDVNPNFRGKTNWLNTMCFDSEGALYCAAEAMWMMDSESGIFNPTYSVMDFPFFCGSTFIEGPTPNFALWLTGTAGHYMGAKTTGATPNGQVMLLWAKGTRFPSPIPNYLPCAGVVTDIGRAVDKVAIKETDASGAATFGPGPRRVPAEAGRLIWLQAVDLSNCELSNRIQIWH